MFHYVQHDIYTYLSSWSQEGSQMKLMFSCFTTFNMTVKALNNLTCNSDDRKNLKIGFMLYSCFTFNKICMLILLSWRLEGSQKMLLFSCFWSCYLCSDIARVFEESFKVMAVELSWVKGSVSASSLELGIDPDSNNLPLLFTQPTQQLTYS